MFGPMRTMPENRKIPGHEYPPGLAMAGEYTVSFSGMGGRIEIARRASTRDHFASGAIRAARWAAARESGLYDMSHVLGL